MRWRRARTRRAAELAHRRRLAQCARRAGARRVSPLPRLDCGAAPVAVQLDSSAVRFSLRIAERAMRGTPPGTDTLVAAVTRGLSPDRARTSSRCCCGITGRGRQRRSGQGPDRHAHVDGNVDVAQTSRQSETVDARLGSVTLHPHQVSAIRRIESALEEFGGALLCDEVGMGKTFVALAVAEPVSRNASSWRLRCFAICGRSNQNRRSGDCHLCRSSSSVADDDSTDRFDLVVIDEAHHARNRGTRRYEGLSTMVMQSRVLLLSATPIHNSRRDLTALLALFLGSRAASLSRAEIARCVIRREVESCRACVSDS